LSELTQSVFAVGEEWDGERLDKVLGELLRQSRSFAQRVIAEGGVLVNDKSAQKSALLFEGDVLRCAFAPPEALAAKPEALPLDIRYEDDDLLVVNKPQGMVVHPAPGHAAHTLVNALLWHCEGRLSGINGVLRPGIVHRIDKDTSGLLVVAKTDLAHTGLCAQLADHSFLREYRAVLHGGAPRPPQGSVNAPIGRSERDRKRMCVTPRNGKSAVTHYETLARSAAFSFVRLRLETGRTHQIRVHMAHLGHPVAGDPVYGPKPPARGLLGQCLHAGLLGFVHPRSGAFLRLEAELPPWFSAFLERAGLEEP
jgi:23S rRNA pseudouridine1911/1915/1917 synthase